MKLIGFTGVSRSGKTTAAHMLTPEVFSFAAPFKSMLHGLYENNGLSNIQIQRRMEGDLKDMPDRLFALRTPRDMMIWLGQSGRREVHPEIWVNTVESEILRSGAAVIAVSDVRQPNEAAMIKRLGGQIVMITGRGEHSGDRTDDLDFEVDHTFDNSGTLDDLKRFLNSLHAASAISSALLKASPE
jgi:hypothetical protein